MKCIWVNMLQLRHQGGERQKTDATAQTVLQSLHLGWSDFETSILLLKFDYDNYFILSISVESKLNYHNTRPVMSVSSLLPGSCRYREEKQSVSTPVGTFSKALWGIRAVNCLVQIFHNCCDCNTGHRSPSHIIRLISSPKVCKI